MDRVLVEAWVDAPERWGRCYFMPLASLVVPAKIILRGSDAAASSWLADLSLRVLAVKSALARQNNAFDLASGGANHHERTSESL
jgi:hypothetical protein